MRKIYEELVLKKPKETVVQIGSMDQIRMAVPGATVKPVQIAPANGNGNGHSNGNGNGAAGEKAGRSRRRRLNHLLSHLSSPTAPGLPGLLLFGRRIQLPTRTESLQSV